MAASYGKFSELHIERVWSLTLAGYTNRKITRLLANGFPRESPPVPPLKVSEQAVGQLVKSMRSQWEELESIKMATVPTEANADALRARILRIANREAERLAALQSVGKLDGDLLRKLASAAKAIEAMEDAAAARKRKRSPSRQPAPQAVPDDAPQSVVSGLLRKGADLGEHVPATGDAEQREGQAQSQDHVGEQVAAAPVVP